MHNYLRDVFSSLQQRLAANLSANRAALKHPVAKGEASEINWLEMLEAHLPHRYRVGKAFIIDADGLCSEQIDVVIYDRQYTPPLYNRDNQLLIPSESVYAIFEVKQIIDKANIEYAGQKAASVRRLRRTSAIITHAGGYYKPREPFEILAGILAYDSSWSPPLGDTFTNHINQLPGDQHLDIGCIVNAGYFEVKNNNEGEVYVEVCPADTALVRFFFGLLQRMQQLGTVTAIDYDDYLRKLID